MGLGLTKRRKSASAGKKKAQAGKKKSRAAELASGKGPLTALKLSELSPQDYAAHEKRAASRALIRRLEDI